MVSIGSLFLLHRYIKLLATSIYTRQNRALNPGATVLWAMACKPSRLCWTATILQRRRASSKKLGCIWKAQSSRYTYKTFWYQWSQWNEDATHRQVHSLWLIGLFFNRFLRALGKGTSCSIHLQPQRDWNRGPRDWKAYWCFDLIHASSTFNS